MLSVLLWRTWRGRMSEPRTRDEAVVKIACVQMEPVVGQKERNVRRTLEFIEQAAAIVAHLVVLPELCNSGYVFESRQEAFSLAEEIPNGPTCHAWKDIARQRGLHIVAGIDERDGQALYNAAVLIGPSGHVGTFRKLHLWNEENLFFEPGNLGFPVFRTPLGRIATFICYDGWFPESYRLCALQGADVVCIPTNWVPIPGQEKDREAMANILCMASAHANAVCVAAADRVGVERGQPFVGQSLIVSYTGWPIAGPASPDREEIIYAEANLADTRRKRNWNEYNQVLRDRRTDVYDEMLGAKLSRGWYCWAVPRDSPRVFRSRSRWPRKEEAERQTNRELPVGRRAADAMPRPGVEKHVLRGRLPDGAEECRVVRPLALRALAVDLADEAEPRMHRQLSDDTPDTEAVPVVSIEAAATVDVHRDRRQLSADDTDRLEPDAVLVKERRRQQRSGFDRKAHAWLVLEHALLQDAFQEQPRIG